MQDARPDDAPPASGGATGPAAPLPYSAAESSTVSPTGPRRRAWFLEITVQVILISLGVFIALLGDEWRERAQNRELAHDSLRRFRAEILENKNQVARVKDYHAEMRLKIREYLRAESGKRDAVGLRLQGIQVVWFEHTAWDLALATGALGHIDSELAFNLARVYNAQKSYSQLTDGIIQTMYVRPLGEDLVAFLRSLDVYYGDIVDTEPRLIEMYDAAIPMIDRALGGP